MEKFPIITGSKSKAISINVLFLGLLGFSIKKILEIYGGNIIISLLDLMNRGVLALIISVIGWALFIYPICKTIFINENILQHDGQDVFLQGEKVCKTADIQIVRPLPSTLWGQIEIICKFGKTFRVPIVGIKERPSEVYRRLAALGDRIDIPGYR